MFIVIVLLLLSSSLYPAELSPAQMAEVDHRVQLEQNKVLKAELALVCAQLEKQSEEDIKKHEAEVRRAATEMLFVLAYTKEQGLRLADIDFCLAHNPDVNAVDEEEIPLLFRAASHNITLVRELIRVKADVHRTADTSLSNKTTILQAAEYADNFNRPLVTILLEAGAEIPFNFDHSEENPCAWFWEAPMTVHRQNLIDTISEANILLPVLSPIIADYAFGAIPTVQEELGDDEMDASITTS